MGRLMANPDTALIKVFLNERRLKSGCGELPLSKVYQLPEPGPVVLLTTAPRKGRANVMAMSWHMMIEFEPPQLACVVSNANYSFAALRATGECVIAVPARKLVTTVVKVGNSSGRNVLDKFAAFGLTKVPAKRVIAASRRRLLRQSRMQSERHPFCYEILPFRS